jgi:hypothetical protein
MSVNLNLEVLSTKEAYDLVLPLVKDDPEKASQQLLVQSFEIELDHAYKVLERYLRTVRNLDDFDLSQGKTHREIIPHLIDVLVKVQAKLDEAYDIL